MTTIEDRLEQIEQRLTQPVDVTALIVSPKVVVSIVIVCLAIAGSVWGVNYSLHSDVRDIITKLADKEKLDSANAKLTEERQTNLKQTVDMIDRKQELQRLEIQEIKETLIRRSVGGGPNAR